MKKIALILLIGTATQFVFVSKGAIYGESVSSMEEKIDQLKDQNQRLEIEVATLTSCTNISGETPEVIFSLSPKRSSDFSMALKR